MGFQDGQKGYTFGIIALICWVVSIIFNLIGVSAVGSVAGFAVLVFGIMAFVIGKKEFAADPQNKKAKTGKTIGLVIIIVEVVTLVLFVVLAGTLIGGSLS
ncbi:MAG: hypothetical protein PHN26_08570 [Eubacteriaceae bacterium]|jgi:hypothetical protein|nr:hypothetical protein [Eubacteriaceae bacterium]